MAITLSIPGRREPSLATATRGAAEDAARVTTLLDDIEVVASFSLPPAAPAAPGSSRP